MPGQAQLLWLFQREREGDMVSAVRIGTRSSPLARWQAEWVAGQVRRHHPDRDFVVVEIKTQGDRDQNSPLATNGGIGVFTKEIQRELLEGTIDLAVHSLKDLPTQAPPGLALAVVPPREEPGDALIAPTSRTLDALPERARVGTGSLRRRAQLLHLRPDLEVVAVRGNVETRLDQVLQGRLDAVVLAEAGLRRLGLDRHVTQRLAPPAFLPAVAQGALGLECRADDVSLRRVRPVNPIFFPAEPPSMMGHFMSPSRRKSHGQSQAAGGGLGGFDRRVAREWAQPPGLLPVAWAQPRYDAELGL
jgi:hydroxymethylbilane synthase